MNILKGLLFLALYYTFSSIMKLVGLFSEGGATLNAEMVKNAFYSPLLLEAGFIILVFQIINFSGQNFETIRKLLKGTQIHNPEDSIIKSKWLQSIPNMLFASIIFFSIIGIVGTQANLFFADTPIQQQITPIGKTLLGTYPGAGAETLIFFAILISGVVLNNMFQRRFKYGDAVWAGINIGILPILGAIGWRGLHLLRYGDSQLSTLATLAFGYFGSLITMVTGSVIPWLIYHDENNIFVILNKLFDNTIILWVTIGVLVGITIIYLVLKGKGNGEN